MAEIKLYGNVVNSDGKYIISPFDIAAPKSDGKTAYTEDDKADDKNIVSYINAKVSSLTTGISNVKTGITSATFAPLTLAPAVGGTATTSISVLAKDGSEATGKLSITLPSADTIVTSATSYTNTKNTVADLVTKMNTVQGADTVTGSIAKGNKDTLKSANDYTNNQITTLKNKIGDVYQIKGSKTLTEFQAITSFVKGDVYNISEEFLIGGRKYPAYTNVVSLVDKSAAMTFASSTGFTDDEVDALGGVQDLSNYSTLADTVKSASWSAEATGAPLSSTTAGTRGTITLTKADNSTTTVTVTSKDSPDALKRTGTAANVGIQVTTSTLSLSGISDAAGSLVSKGVTLSTKAPSVTVTQASNGVTIGVSGDGDVFNRSISAGTTATIPVSTSYIFGVIKTDSTIINNAGTLSLPKNEMKTSDYLSVTTVSPNAGKGVDFTFDIVADKITDIGNITSRLKTNTIAPLMKIPSGEMAQSACLGIPLVNNVNQTYVKIQMYTENNFGGTKTLPTDQMGGWYLGLDDTALTNKINELSKSIANNQSGLEARVSALETLLSLA